MTSLEETFIFTLLQAILISLLCDFMLQLCLCALSLWEDEDVSVCLWWHCSDWSCGPDCHHILLLLQVQCFLHSLMLQSYFLLRNMKLYFICHLTKQRLFSFLLFSFSKCLLRCCTNCKEARERAREPTALQEVIHQDQKVFHRFQIYLISTVCICVHH